MKDERIPGQHGTIGFKTSKENEWKLKAALKNLQKTKEKAGPKGIRRPLEALPETFSGRVIVRDANRQFVVEAKNREIADWIVNNL